MIKIAPSTLVEKEEKLVTDTMNQAKVLKLFEGLGK